MPDKSKPKFQRTPDQHRAQAKRLRAKARDEQDPEKQRQARAIAHNLDKIAARIESRAAKPSPAAKPS